MKITINGREYYRDERKITYDEIVEHVYGKDVKAIVSISYHWNGQGDLSRQGIISPGQSIKVEDNMHFSAYYTDNA